MNPVCKFIQFIKELTDDEFCYYLGYIPSTIYFKNGGCYELVKTLKYFLPEGEIYLAHDSEQYIDHCALFYKGILYDIDGVINNNNLFHAVDKTDMEYLDDESFYGRNEIKFEKKQPSEALIEEIKKCKIEYMIEACKNMDDNPDYYSQKKLVKSNLK